MIRRVRECDIERCLDVIHQSFETVAREFGLTTENCPGHTSFMRIERLNRQFAENGLMFCCELQGEIIGYFSLNDNGRGAFALENLAVLPEFRHRGIGGEMVQFAADFAADSGAPKIEIGIIDESATLKSWYQKLGFVQTGMQKFPHLPFTVGFMELAITKDTTCEG